MSDIDKDFMMSPKVDFAFKELMTDADVRKGFLSAVLNISPKEIQHTVLKNPVLEKEHEDEKQGILDVLVLMNDNTEINIEIQLYNLKTWSERSTFYLAKLLATQPGINRTYSNIRKCIAINILDFKHFKETDRYHTVFHIREDVENFKFTDIMEWHIIELPKEEKDDGTDLYQWISFIKAERREEFRMLAEKNEYLAKAYEKLDVISQDEQKRIAYLSRQKAISDYNSVMLERFEDGIAQGRAEGRAEGRAAERAEWIAKLRAANIDEETIRRLSS